MQKLTPEGERIIAALAERYAIGVDAVKTMLDAVVKGGGTMAQFNLPEFGGSGQWMRGGMTMIGDMFNNTMKATVDNLCSELSNVLASQPNFFATFSQSQTQSQGGGAGDGVSVFVSQSSGTSWWPSELGNPSSTGAQNNLRYAYFPGSNRLAIDYGGRVEVYDTTGHNITGFGQQQSGDASLTFTSQRGVVRVSSLPKVGGAPQAKPAASAPSSAPQPADGDTAAIISLLQQLSQLKEKGILTEEEFAAKKAELLKRL
jgi:hypothetical protein